MIGSGYVGLVSGTCFSELGHDIICVDRDPERIEKLRRNVMPIYEPGLAALVAKNVAGGRLSFTTDLKAAVDGADAVFIAVGTPSRRGDGRADLTYVYAAAAEIANALTGYAVVVTKSTVPVGTGREVAAIIRKTRPDADFDVASNPEFLREGAAINDFMRPDRVVIGVESDRAREVLSSIYRPLYLIERPIVSTTLETAELIKYASNSFLAMKITFINEVANLCEKVGADVHDVAKAIGLDGRIGPKFLHPGPGYGGSCFPKDTLAFAQTAQDYGARQHVIETVIEVNERRKAEMTDRIVAAFGGSVRDRTIAVLGLTFKPNTDDMREAPSLTILPALLQAGARIQAFDPEGMEEARKHLPPGIIYATSAYDVLEGADGTVVLTEWNEFRGLDLKRMREAMRGDVFIDLRNVYKPGEMTSAGFRYQGLGRPVPAAQPSAVAQAGARG